MIPNFQSHGAETRTQRRFRPSRRQGQTQVRSKCSRKHVAHRQSRPLSHHAIHVWYPSRCNWPEVWNAVEPCYCPFLPFIKPQLLRGLWPLDKKAGGTSELSCRKDSFRKGLDIGWTKRNVFGCLVCSQLVRDILGSTCWSQGCFGTSCNSCLVQNAQAVLSRAGKTRVWLVWVLASRHHNYNRSFSLWHIQFSFPSQLKTSKRRNVPCQTLPWSLSRFLGRWEMWIRRDLCLSP